MVIFAGIVAVLSFIVLCLDLLFPIIDIEGCSMMPTFKSGEYKLAFIYITPLQLKVNKVYVFSSPTGCVAIKRLTAIKKVGRERYCFFEGDNSEDSLDSREYGYVSHKYIIAVVFGGKKENEF